MMLFAGWVLIKVVKGIFIVLSLFFYTGNDKRPPTHTKNKESIAKSEEPTIENKPPELKSENAVYTSLRDKLYKAFEVLKKEGYPVTWALDDSGFFIPISGSIFEGSEIYEAAVRINKKNTNNLKDPYYILVAYGVLFKASDFDYYKEMSEYLNKYIYKELKKPGIFFNLDYVEDTNFKIIYCNLTISNNENSYEDPRKLSDPEEIQRLFNEAKQAYHEGVNLYRFRD